MSELGIRAADSAGTLAQETGPRTVATVNSYLKFLEVATIPDFRFHDTRHTFASRLAMAGVDLYTVQRAGGWRTQVMVQRYAHPSPDHMKAAVERLAQ